MTNDEFKELEEKYLAESKRRKEIVRLNVMKSDLGYAKENGRGYNTVCCHLTGEEQEKLYVFLKNLFDEELKELCADE